MKDTLLQKISPRRSRLRKTFGGGGGGGGTHHNNQDEHPGESRDEVDTELHRKRGISSQLKKICRDSYNQGVDLLLSKRYEEAREDLEAALAARLVIYGPDNECLIEVHEKLRHIAYIQGNLRKVAYHDDRISHVRSALQSARILNDNENRYHDSVDWSKFI